VAQIFPLNADGAASGEAQSRLIRTLARLPEQWTLLRDRLIENEPVDGVLIHPDIGIALVNLAPRQAEAAADALGHRLERERFAAYFPGALPLVPLAVPAEAIPEVGEQLANAFEAAPRLDIADRDWVDALIEMLLLPDDFAMAPAEVSRPLPDLAESALAEEPEMAAEGAFPAPVAPSPSPEAPRWVESAHPESAETSWIAEPTAPAEPEPEWEEPIAIRSDPFPRAVEPDPLTRRDSPAMPLPAPLLTADEPIALARPRRHGEHWLVASAVTTGILLGLLLLGWPQTEPPTRVVERGQSTVALPTPPVADVGTTPQAEPSSPLPPPVPPGPVTMLAAKPLVTPPLLRHATAVAPLPSLALAPPPPPVAAAPPPAATPPVAVAPAPTPVAEAAPPAPRERPTETRHAAAPAARHAPPSETASLTPPSRFKHKPRPQPARGRPSEGNDEALPDATARTESAPPVDAADLPPLEHAPSTAVAAPAHAATGAPIPLVPRQPPERLSGSTTPTPRECRPYTGTTTLSGREAPVQGLACRDSDGQWHLVSETTPR